MGGSSSALKPVLENFIASKEVIPIQDDFWEQFWPAKEELPLAAVMNDITPENIRFVRNGCSKNLATLLRRAVLKLKAASMTGLANAESKTQTTNAIRVLIRIVPYILEEPSWNGLWWTPTPVGVIVPMPDGHTNPPMFKGAPDAAMQREEEAIKAAEPPPPDEQLPLAVTLLTAIMDLLFAPCYTAAKTQSVGPPSYERKRPEGARSVRSHDGSNFIWAAGLGHEKNLPISRNVDTRRSDLLRLLIACVSQPLYVKPRDLEPKQQPFLSFVVGGSHRNTVPLVWSLINVVCGYDPVGWGMPYGQVFSPDPEREQLLSLAGQFLGIALDISPANQITVVEEAEVEVEMRNVMREFVETISSEEHFAFITRGICRLLTNPYEQTWMPGSQKRVELTRELVSFFWKICDVNRQYLGHVLKSKDALDLLVPILHAINEAREDVSKIGLVQVGIYIILMFSGERNFAVLLNKPFTHPYPIDVPSFSGTHGDLLILVIHNLMVGTNIRLTSLYECLLTAIANISPYLKTLTLIASNKLVHLFEVFSSPRFILANETNHHLVFYLLESFNNLIQYQFEGNTHLVYVLIRRRKIFHAFEQLSLSSFADESVVLEPDSEQQVNIIYSPEKAVAPADKAKKAKKPVIKGKLQPESDGQEHFTVEQAEAKHEMEITQGVVDTAEEGDIFAPTDEWLTGWFSKLPLATIQRTLQVLVPQVEQMCKEKNVTDEADILEFLQKGTLVGLLPVPHPILIRRSQVNPGSSVWNTCFQWATIYIKNLSPPLFHGANVNLFHVSEK